MKIYNYDSHTGQYVGESFADQDPLVQGNWLVPAHATTIEPLQPQEDKLVCFENGIWFYKDIPVKPLESQLEPYKPSVEEVRRFWYQVESDPLYFKWKRGESTEQAWLDKVAEIKAREIV